MLLEYIKGIKNHRYIMMSLVSRDLMAKYRRSKLGVLWSLMMPMGLAFIVGMVYSILFSNDPREFIPLIFASLNPWNFMSNSADHGTFAFPAAEGYIKQSTVAPQVFPLRITLVNFFNLMYSVLAFFCIYLFLKPDNFGPIMLMCIPGLFIMFIFSLGLANISSIITLYLRDYQPLQNLAFQGLFYATPIIYPAEMLAERGFAFVYQINPFYYMLEIVRKPMMGIGIPPLSTYVIALAFAAISFTVGLTLVMRNRTIVAYKL